MLVSAAAVRDGAPDLAYSLVQANKTVATGNSTYDGCSAWRETAVSDVYSRADGTEYVQAKGAGAPTGPVDVCVTTVIETRPVSTGGYLVSTGGGCANESLCWTNYNMMSIYQNVSKTEKKNTETGQSISLTCAFANNNWNGWSGLAGQCSNGYSGNSCGGWRETPTQWVSVPPCPF